MHQVDDEADRIETQDQVLAAATNAEQWQAVRLIRSGNRSLQRSEVERRELRQDPPAELSLQPLGVRLDLRHLRHTPRLTTTTARLGRLASELLVGGLFLDSGEHGIERAEHRLVVEQFLLVAPDPNVAVDERILRVHLTRCHGNCGVPGLFHLHVLGIGDASAEGGLTIAHLDVIGDITFGTIGNDLSDANLVRCRDFAHVVARCNLRSELVDPVETEVSVHPRSLPDREPDIRRLRSWR